MTQSQIIAGRLREVLLTGKWIANTNFKEQIQSLNWKQATQKIGNLNTVAALTYHINYYLAGLTRVLEVGPLEIRDKYSFDLPPIHSGQEWQALISDFLENAEAFAARVEHLSDHELDKPFVDEKYGTYRRNIEGVIEHNYYHLGQISLLKKMILTREPDTRDR